MPPSSQVIWKAHLSFFPANFLIQKQNFHKSNQGKVFLLPIVRNTMDDRHQFSPRFKNFPIISHSPLSPLSLCLSLSLSLLSLCLSSSLFSLSVSLSPPYLVNLSTSPIPRASASYCPFLSRFPPFLFPYRTEHSSYVCPISTGFSDPFTLSLTLSRRGLQFFFPSDLSHKSRRVFDTCFLSLSVSFPLLVFLTNRCLLGCLLSFPVANFVRYSFFHFTDFWLLYFSPFSLKSVLPSHSLSLSLSQPKFVFVRGVRYTKSYSPVCLSSSSPSVLACEDWHRPPAWHFYSPVYPVKCRNYFLGVARNPHFLSTVSSPKSSAKLTSLALLDIISLSLSLSLSHECLHTHFLPVSVSLPLCPGLISIASTLLKTSKTLLSIFLFRLAFFEKKEAFKKFSFEETSVTPSG